MNETRIDVQKQSATMHIPVFPIGGTKIIRNTKQLILNILVEMSLRKADNIEVRQIVLYITNFVSYASNIEMEN